MGLDYRPDVQPQTPGILVVASNVVPVKDGSYFTSWAPTDAIAIGGIAAPGTTPLIGQMVQTPTVYRLIIGSTSKLYDFDGTNNWTDRSAANYGLTGSQRWSITQFGDETLAGTPAYAIQTSTVGNSFASLANAPKAKALVVQSGHILACNYDDGTANPAGVKWCSQGASTTWTAAGGNSAGTATLRESFGPIVGAAKIHDIVVVWKATSMYIGRRVGGTEIWRFNLLSPKIGLVHQDAWVDTPVGLIFVSENGIFRFDGSIPQPIDEGIRVKFYTSLSTLATSTQITHDESRGCIFIWIASQCFCYNYLCNKWSVAYASTGNLGNSSYPNYGCTVRDATYAGCSSLNITAVNGSAFRTAHLIFDTNKKLVNLSSQSPNNTFIATLTGGFIRASDAGPDDETFVERSVPLWAWENGAPVVPTAATLALNVYSRPDCAAGSLTLATTASLDTKSRFDLHQSGNTFRAQLTVTDQYFGIQDLGYKMKRQGSR